MTTQQEMVDFANEGLDLIRAIEAEDEANGVVPILNPALSLFPEDGNAFRGMVYGVLLSSLFWIGGAVLIWWVNSR